MKPVDELKTKLIQAWRDLKNKDIPDDHRSAAYADIVNLSEEITKLDNTFEMDTKLLLTYKEFKSAEVKPRVTWPIYEDDSQFKGLETYFDKLIALAVKIAHKRLPRIPQDSDKFGTIVNATMAHLIALEKN